jgi:type IV secretory pathway TrbD component
MDNADQVRSIPIHQSFLRPLLMLGAERELVILSAILSAMLVFSLANAYFAVLGILFWLSSVAVLQRLAKIDPQISRVYVRHVRYRNYYPASGHPRAQMPEVRAQQ